jgi:uncharacterized protein YndB with AHSA1/START domain
MQFDDINESEIKKVVTIDATVATVWDTLTKPELIKNYAPNIEVISDWKVGSHILWIEATEHGEMIRGKGYIEKFEDKKLFQFSILDMRLNYADEPFNYIQTRIELTPNIGKALLSLTEGDYSRVENGKKRFKEADNNWDQTLAALKQFIENKKLAVGYTNV